ncbi:MAG TPA: asparagine synthase-related protein [Candidatus Nitrosotenuis sp.]|nr:asparagine synthase-related protein [Candidatus Nitrosotenuis sp.]
MQEFVAQAYNVLKGAVEKCTAEYISLSGGLDSTILAYFLKERKIKAISIIAKDFVASDLTYCQLVAQRLDIPLSIKMCDAVEVSDGIENTIKILKNFNDIEIRNNVVSYLALSEVKNAGYDKIVTGDGADELFAGYNFLLNKSQKDLELDLQRIAKIMHFPSHKLGKALGICVESPFCDSKVVEFAQNLPIEFKVRQEGDKKFGKWILRKAFEDEMPKSICWRQKSPMQEGAGTQGLTEFFEVAIPDSVFFEKIKKIKEKDGVTIRTKESLHYYEIYKKYYELDAHDDSVNQCPDCRQPVETNSKFCRMCGRYPL